MQANVRRQLPRACSSCVQASNNKRALRNLAVSSADILSAVNQLLSRKGMNEHIRALLNRLEKYATLITSRNLP